MTIVWEAAGATHVGRVRKGNEDSLRLNPDLGIFVVADGMGGHAAGEVASRIAADAVLETLQTQLTDQTGASREEALRGAFAEAHKRILDCCRRDRRTLGMGTTLTTAVLNPSGRLDFGHLGDSRLYQLHRDKLLQLTRDHTWVQQEVDAGRIRPEAARRNPLSHILTRVLTADEPPVPDVSSAAVLPGDTLLLCSDGLHNLIDGQELLELLLVDGSPAVVVERLIKTANRRGGTDNITAVLIRIA